MAARTSKTIPDPTIQALQAYMQETALTTSRPLSAGEFMYALARRGGGMSDPSTIVSLVCSGGHAIADDDVVLACAALRLRYPLLASNVIFVGSPHFVVHSPLTRAHALRTAREQVEFHTFDDQEKAVVALRDEWLAFDADNALDIRERTCALWWGRDADPQSGKYVLGLMTTHFVTDNRRRLNLVRRFLELLASPGRALAELDAHFAEKAPPAPIPIPTEELKPELAADEEEARQAKIAFDELVTRYSTKPVSGIVGDGSATAALVPRILRKVWSSDETSRILRGCKAHGVTITHLVNVAGALSSVHGRSPSPDEDAFYFDFSQAMDLTAKVPEHAQKTASGDMEAAVRIEMYPVILRAARAAADDMEKPAHAWALAKQFKEQNDAFVKSPHFWRFLPMYRPLMTESYNAKLAGRPAMPFMSSLGDLKTVLPARYPVQDASAEIRITEKWTAGRIDPFSLVYHLFTFDGQLYLQFRYNANRTSDALIEPWFARVVDIVSQSTENLPSSA